MTFWQALWELMLGNTGRVSDSYHGSAILVFTAGSALMGVVAVLLDSVVFLVRRHSFFSLTYSRPLNAVRLICLWGVGAGFGGFLGSAGSIVQFTRAACIGVGVGWPLILPRLIDSFTREQQEDKQTPEDQ